jgi:hypothetical protein
MLDLAFELTETWVCLIIALYRMGYEFTYGMATTYSVLV